MPRALFLSTLGSLGVPSSSHTSYYLLSLSAHFRRLPTNSKRPKTHHAHSKPLTLRTSQMNLIGGHSALALLYHDPARPSHEKKTLLLLRRVHGFQQGLYSSYSTTRLCVHN